MKNIKTVFAVALLFLIVSTFSSIVDHQAPVFSVSEIDSREQVAESRAAFAKDDPLGSVYAESIYDPNAIDLRYVLRPLPSGSTLKGLGSCFPKPEPEFHAPYIDPVRFQKRVACHQAGLEEQILTQQIFWSDVGVRDTETRIWMLEMTKAKLNAIDLKTDSESFSGIIIPRGETESVKLEGASLSAQCITKPGEGGHPGYAGRLNEEYDKVSTFQGFPESAQRKFEELQKSIEEWQNASLFKLVKMGLLIKKAFSLKGDFILVSVDSLQSMPEPGRFSGTLVGQELQVYPGDMCDTDEDEDSIVTVSVPFFPQSFCVDRASTKKMVLDDIDEKIKDYQSLVAKFQKEKAAYGKRLAKLPTSYPECYRKD